MGISLFDNTLSHRDRDFENSNSDWKKEITVTDCNSQPMRLVEDVKLMSRFVKCFKRGRHLERTRCVNCVCYSG